MVIPGSYCIVNAVQKKNLLLNWRYMLILKRVYLYLY